MMADIAEKIVDSLFELGESECPHGLVRSKAIERVKQVMAGWEASVEVEPAARHPVQRTAETTVRVITDRAELRARSVPACESGAVLIKADTIMTFGEALEFLRGVIATCHAHVERRALPEIIAERRARESEERIDPPRLVRGDADCGPLRTES